MDQPIETAAKPLWRRIADFPLATLFLAAIPLVFAMGVVEPLLLALGLDRLPARWTPWIEPAAIGLLTTAAALLVYKLWVVRLGEEPRDELPFDARSIDFGRGTLVAVLLMSVIVGVVAALGGYRIAGWGNSASFAWFLFIGGIQAGVTEEILIRGIVFKYLEQFGGSWFALALSSALFGFAHAANPNATVLSSLAIAIEAGIMLGGAYMLTRNLWLAVGLHFGWNFAQGYLWDVPVSGFGGDGLVAARPLGDPLISGGAFGLEASLVALVLATALGGWFVVLSARRGNLVRPWWVRRRLARADQTKL